MLSVKMVSKPGLTIAALVLSPPGHVVAIAGLLPPEHPALLIIYSSADEHLPRIRSLKGHILFGRAQAGLVAAHQEIGITIDDFRLEEERPFGVTRRKFVASALNPLSSIHAVSNGFVSPSSLPLNSDQGSRKIHLGRERRVVVLGPEKELQSA